MIVGACVTVCSLMSWLNLVNLNQNRRVGSLCWSTWLSVSHRLLVFAPMFWCDILNVLGAVNDSHIFNLLNIIIFFSSSFFIFLGVRSDESYQYTKRLGCCHYFVRNVAPQVWRNGTKFRCVTLFTFFFGKLHVDTTISKYKDSARFHLSSFFPVYESLCLCHFMHFVSSLFTNSCESIGQLFSFVFLLRITAKILCFHQYIEIIEAWFWQIWKEMKNMWSILSIYLFEPTE